MTGSSGSVPDEAFRIYDRRDGRKADVPARGRRSLATTMFGIEWA
jgi:hypothetical protein